MRKKQRLLFFSHDQGGIQAILPVADCFLNHTNVEIVRATTSIGVRQHPKVPWNIVAETSEWQWYISLLTDSAPDLVITGTSYQPKPGVLTPEQQVIAECRTRNIKTISILDYWGFYRARFSRNHDQNFDLLPDIICALDDRCKEDLIRDGVPTEKIVVTHNPFFDAVVASRPRYDPGLRLTSPQQILFCSQPLAEKGWKNQWGFDQFDVFEWLRETIQNNDVFENANIEIWVHPKERLETWLKKYTDQRFLINRRNSKPLPLSCSALVTCYSTTVFEALHLDIPCLTILPNPSCPIEMITEHYELTRFIHDKSSLQSALLQIPSNRTIKASIQKRTQLERRSLFFSGGDATKKITQLIERSI
ncbi:MAG: hypothetical protein RL563_2447 [Pseudomonadota bacterium]|jgi:hypothetical protein